MDRDLRPAVFTLGIWAVACLALALVSCPAHAADARLPESVTPANTLRTNVNKTGSLASSATTADQVVVTYTVTAGKTLFIQTWDIATRLTTFAATATLFGTCSLESPAGTKLNTWMLAGTGYAGPILESVGTAEPLTIAAGVVVRIVCTPAAATAFTWQANFMGFER